MVSLSRRRVAKYVAKQLVDGESSARIARVLAAYLSSNNNLRQADMIVRDIESEILRDYGHLKADVTSAAKLTQEKRDLLTRMLKSETGAKTVELVEIVDDSLIGGVIVRTPEAELDASIKRKLTRLKAI